MDLGFIKAGYTPIWANDIDKHAVATYNDLMSGHSATLGDILTHPVWDTLPEPGAADLVIGGPPCQGFSVAGKMDPDDPRSRHVWTFMEVVKKLSPKAFVLENVKSLAAIGRWASLIDDLKESTREVGYEPSVWVLNAAHYGVPQARERMFLVGTRDGCALPPTPTTKDNPPTVRSKLASLPAYGTPGNNTRCAAKVTLAKNPVIRKSPYAGMLFNGQGRPLNLDAPSLTLPASMGGNRTPIVDQEALENGVPHWVLAYHKHLQEGGEPLTEVPNRLRRITVEEAAAMQTFPSGTTWHGANTSKYRLIGNAVPPELAYRVAKVVKSTFGIS